MTLSCLPCALFCSCPCKVRSRVSDALSQALCNLSLTFLADFTLSDSTAPIRFIGKLFSLVNYTGFRLNHKTRSQRSHVFRLTGTAALHCGHTFVGGILTANGQSNSQRMSLPRTKWPLATCPAHAHFLRSKNGRLIM